MVAFFYFLSGEHMSDLVTRDILATPSNGQAAQANGEGLGASAEQTSSGQSAPDENIRKLQSTYDKKLVEQQRSFQQQQQAQSQQMNALQNELRNMKYAAAPDDYTRKELEVEELRKERDQYAYAYQQMTAAQREEQERVSALRDIADEFDVSVKDLDGATDYKSAVKLALKAQLDKEKRKTETDNDKRERNQVDYGGGAPRTPTGKWDEDYAAARDRKDSVEMMRLLNERKGK
jgi:hypothetical protein